MWNNFNKVTAILNLSHDKVLHHDDPSGRWLPPYCNICSCYATTTNLKRASALFTVTYFQYILSNCAVHSAVVLH